MMLWRKSVGKNMVDCSRVMVLGEKGTKKKKEEEQEEEEKEKNLPSKKVRELVESNVSRQTPTTKYSPLSRSPESIMCCIRPMNSYDLPSMM